MKQIIDKNISEKYRVVEGNKKKKKNDQMRRIDAIFHETTRGDNSWSPYYPCTPK
jgi:hypothetical protein